MALEIKIVLISNDLKVNHDLRQILENEFAASTGHQLNLKIYSSLPSLDQAVVHYGPHLMIICMEPEEREKKLVFLNHLKGVAVRLPVIVSAPELDADLMLSCIKKGVRDFIRQPFDSAEIQDMISRLFLESQTNMAERQQGATYTFFSYKGGIGTTFLSCNIAVAIARMSKGRVLLWDMVLQNGDIPFFFDYQPNATLTELLDNVDKIDESYLNAVLPPHVSGVSILAGPKRPEDAESIRSDQIQTLHETLRKHFDHIIVDAGHMLSDHVIGVLDNSKNILLITDLHLPVLKNTLRCLEVFERLGYVEGKFKVILNRYNSKYEKFDLSKAQEILGYPIALAISNEYFTAARSLNTGIPVADLDKESVLTKQFDELARMILMGFKAQDSKKEKAARGGFQGFFGKKKKKGPPEEPKAINEAGNAA